jgi:hypothetical protein
MKVKKPSSTKSETSKSKNPWVNFACFSVFCAFLIGIVTWEADSYSPQESLNPDPANSYYNLLVQGFQSGQLNMKINTPPEFARLADPYDNRTHNWDSGYWTNKVDTSYYKGKFYLYFGVTPALTLFWPCAALTGHYLPDRYAFAIFFALGFLVMWGILCAVRRRYFPEMRFGTFAPGIFIVGLAISLTQSGSINDVTKVSGFTFIMLALAGIWLALHWPARRTWCLLFASLSYGLAVGARPSLLFGAIILLIPVLQTCFGAPIAAPRRQIATSFLSAIIPITLIGLGLMAYNDLRFDSPFEFGRRYQLTFDYESTTSKQLSLHYLWFNIRYYFLEPMRVGAHFPFLQDVSLPPPPSGYTSGHLDEYGGILVNYPLLMLVFLLPLVWRNRQRGEISALRWFMLCLFLLFVTCALTDCLLVVADRSYTLDFLPPLVLLAFMGFLGLDKALSHLPKRRLLARLYWYLLLGYSLVFNVFSNVEKRAFWSKGAGDILQDQGRWSEALVCFRNAVSLEPRQAMYHNLLAVAYSQTGQAQAAYDEFNKALNIDPNCTMAQYNIASILYQSGQTDEAFLYLEKALNGDPNHTNLTFAVENGKNALILISNPDPGKRNVPLAIKLAEAACQETNYKDVRALVASAEVFGENGRTAKAISLAQKAIEVATQNGDSNSLEMAKSLLARYQKSQRLTPPNQGTIRQN